MLMAMAVVFGLDNKKFLYRLTVLLHKVYTSNYTDKVIVT